MKIPFSPPDITEEEIAEVVDTLRSGWITTGPKTKEFERQIAQYCHTERAVCLSSATACMEMTLRLFGIGPGDEVITSAYTYTATASAICHTGARLRLVDTAKDSFEMDYDQLEDLITPATKVIVPVDIAGVPCDYDRINQIVERKKSLFAPGENKYQKAVGRLLVMADCAHGFGAMIGNQPAGQFADFTCFSFHAVKNLTTAEGGAVVWKRIDGIESEEIYREYMLLSLHGQSKDALAKTKAGAWEYDILSPAYKCNMTDIQAAIGLAQIKRYSGLKARRYEVIRRYDEGIEVINRKLKSFHCVSLSHEDGRVCSSGHLYLLRIVGATFEERNRLIERMAQNGVATNVHYKPLPMLTAYSSMGFDIDHYPNAYKMFENEITLPLHTLLRDEEVEYVLNVLEEGLLACEAEKDL